MAKKKTEEKKAVEQPKPTHKLTDFRVTRIALTAGPNDPGFTIARRLTDEEANREKLAGLLVKQLSNQEVASRVVDAAIGGEYCRPCTIKELVAYFRPTYDRNSMAKALKNGQVKAKKVGNLWCIHHSEQRSDDPL